MNKIISFERVNYKILYYRYKPYLISLIIAFVCLLVFLQVIIPQVQDLASIDKESQLIREKINTLKKNTNYLSSLDESDLDSKLKVVSSALPPEKDFAAIIGAIGKAANESSVSVDDYSFQVGELSTKSASFSTKPSIAITLRITGGLDGCQRFLKELNKSLPLSEVASVQLGGDSCSITTMFYFKPFSPLIFNNEVVLPPFAQKEQALIAKLSLWYRPLEENLPIQFIQSSPSATLRKEELGF